MVDFAFVSLRISMSLRFCIVVPVTQYILLIEVCNSSTLVHHLLALLFTFRRLFLLVEFEMNAPHKIIICSNEDLHLL